MIENTANRALDRLEAELEAWRKKGPIGKLHNVVVFIRRTPQRRELVLSFADDIDSDIRDILLEPSASDSNIMLLQDNDTRWNSTYLMIDRALRKSNLIDAFIRRAETYSEEYKRVP